MLSWIEIWPLCRKSLQVPRDLLIVSKGNLRFPPLPVLLLLLIRFLVRQAKRRVLPPLSLLDLLMAVWASLRRLLGKCALFSRCDRRKRRLHIIVHDLHALVECRILEDLNLLLWALQAFVLLFLELND